MHTGSSWTWTSNIDMIMKYMVLAMVSDAGRGCPVAYSLYIAFKVKMYRATWNRFFCKLICFVAKNALLIS